MEIFLFTPCIPPAPVLFISCVSISCLYGFRRLEYSASCVSPRSEGEDFPLRAGCLGERAIGLYLAWLPGWLGLACYRVLHVTVRRPIPACFPSSFDGQISDRSRRASRPWTFLANPDSDFISFSLSLLTAHTGKQSRRFAGHLDYIA